MPPDQQRPPHSEPQPCLDDADVDCVLTATSLLGFLVDGRADLAQELADGTEPDVLVNGQLHISRFLLDGLHERADLDPGDVLDSIRSQALQHRAEPDVSTRS